MYPSSARRARHSLTWSLSVALALAAGVLCAQLTAHPKLAPLATSAAHTSSQVAIASSGTGATHRTTSSRTSEASGRVDTASFESSAVEASESSAHAS